MAAVGVALLVAVFVLPQRKLVEERARKPLYEERCSANWRFAHGVLVAGGNIPMARISFYDDFFVVALVKLTKVLYSEILSTNSKSGWLSNSITIRFGNGRSLVLHPKNFERVRSLIEGNRPK
jgi:hypothetical protein